MKQTEIIRNYLNRLRTKSDGDSEGKNTLWTGMVGYCTAIFCKKFFVEGQTPEIRLFHDKKSMSKQHQQLTRQFLEEIIPKIHNEYTGHPLKIEVAEGSKDMLGIHMADRLVRGVSGGKKEADFKGKIHIADLTNVFKENVIRNQASFGYRPTC